MRYVLIALLLAGCATTPNDVRETGTKTVHALKLPADNAVHCLARNIENYSAGLIPSVRPNEVVVRLGLASTVVFVVTVEPASQGSRAIVWYRGYLLGGEDARAAMLASC